MQLLCELTHRSEQNGDLVGPSQVGIPVSTTRRHRSSLTGFRGNRKGPNEAGRHEVQQRRVSSKRSCFFGIGSRPAVEADDDPVGIGHVQVPAQMALSELRVGDAQTIEALGPPLQLVSIRHSETE